MTDIPAPYLEKKEKKRKFFESVISALESYYIPAPCQDDAHIQAAQIFRDFLTGKYKSLDEGFGLSVASGNPSRDEAYKQAVVNAALILEERGVSYTGKDQSIPDMLAKQGFDTLSEKTIRHWKNENPVSDFSNHGTRHAIYLLQNRLAKVGSN